jgi:intein-encoded DNA endonuclease-like protein
LQELLEHLGYRSWIYREGKERQLYVLETSATFLKNRSATLRYETPAEQIAYVRGYFDAEGGVPSDPDAPFYLQFVQKDRKSLAYVRMILEALGIQCGVLHNPSRGIDPDYWRFFVRRGAHRRFSTIIGSWHPRKALRLNQRVKI